MHLQRDPSLPNYVYDLIMQPRLDFEDMTWKCPKFIIVTADRKEVQLSLIFNYFFDNIMVSIVDEKVIKIKDFM
jgi:hypothetical protein